MAIEKLEVMTKKQKIKFRIGVIVTALIFIGLALLLIYPREVFGNEIGDMILGKGTPNGWVAIGNFFVAYANAILLSILSIVALIFVGNILFIIINLTLKKNNRLITIGSLLKSLVKYAAVVAGICLVLGIWGVNVAGIFAGLGILALIIGLGCKTIVNDIVSGFFIVVDNYFQVGEKVTVDGFTGVVISIGLRTTKVSDWQGNIKCINNSLINTIVNLSRCDSYAEAEIDISFNEDLRRVEAIVINNLPKIKEKIPEIIEGPFYRGVTALDDCGVKLVFHAKVKEWDRVGTSRKLLRELYLLLSDNDVIIPFRQLVVNEPDPIGKPRATKEEKKTAETYLFPPKPSEKETKKARKSMFKEIQVLSN